MVAQNNRKNTFKAWQTPSANICELLRNGAERALTLITEQKVLEEMEHYNIEDKEYSSVKDDPALMASIRRANRSILIHWLTETINHPEHPVKPQITTDMIHNSRELYRLGVPEILLNSARIAQNVAWQHWMNIVFTLTDDPSELKQLLEVSSFSISLFVDANMEMIQTMLNEEDTHGIRDIIFQRRELVTRILDGANLNLRDSTRRLDYPLDVAHHAAFIWSEESDTEISVLEEAAEIFMKSCGQTQSLKIMISSAVLWVWTPATRPIDTYEIKHLVQRLPAVRITFGTGSKGIDGFRRAHFDALMAQRVLNRMHSTARAVSFDQIRLAAIMSHDHEALQRYLTFTLGDLIHASHHIKNTLLVYLECGCNIADASIQLHTHRNTVLRRLTKAEELLPLPLAQNRIHVAAALEVLRWSS